MSNNPYEIWQTRRLLGVFRDAKPVYQYWTPLFGSQINSTDEYIDFEKLPIQNRKLAAFAMPLARGGSIYDDRATLTRFKPAYTKSEDRVDPLMPLVKRAGIDTAMIEPEKLTPVQRAGLIKAAMIAAHRAAWERRLDWLAAKAVIDGKVTLVGENYPTTLVDFARAAGHTIVLGAGSRFGDAGVSIVDWFQSVIDLMVNAEFGGMPVRVTMGSAVWGVIRKDAEFKAHLDLNTKGGNITFERGLVPGEKIFKVGEMQVGGASGARLELWVNNETFTDPTTGAETRFIGTKEVVLDCGADALMGFRCFGRIIDPAANYEAIDFFPKNWVQREGDVEVEVVTSKSAPLMVPINPNTTLKATVLG